MKPLALLLALAALLAAATDDELASSSAAPFDQAFIDAMVPHHQEAIEMAEATKAHGLSELDLQRIADDIIASQQGEIDQMLASREEWFGSRELGRCSPKSSDCRRASWEWSTGAPTRSPDADDVDATFAEMIPHHEGAIAMAVVAE